MVADRADSTFDEDGLRRLNRALKRIGLGVAVVFLAALGVTAAVVGPEDDVFGSGEAARAVYQWGPVGEFEDVACAESRRWSELWRCEYQREGYQCVGFVAEGGGFDPGRCARR